MKTDKLLLVDLSIGIYSGRKFDRQITREVADNHKTTEQAGRYNKNLFPSNPEVFKRVIQVAGEARSKHDALTLPWDDNGCRVLSSKAYVDYNKAMSEIHNRFDSAVCDFIADYDYLVQTSLRILNGMGNLADYPPKSELPNRFNWSLRFLPFPDASDVRVDLPQAELDNIRANVESNTKAQLDKAILDPVKRLYDCVKRMADTLGKPDAIFRNTLVSNLEDLRALLPALNVLDNQELVNLFAQTDCLVAHEPDTLRTNQHTRNDIAAKAEAMKKQLEGYFI